MPDTLSPDLLARYLAGAASDAERAAVEAWAAVPANARELARLRAVWRPAAPSGWNVEDAWQRVRARLDAPATPVAPPVRHWTGPVLAVAATVVLAVGAAVIWRISQPDPGLPAQVVATIAGERRTVDLSDGTRIVLAPGSELRVAEGYGGALRRVDLRGEAWFAVEHDAARPFQVHVAGTITEDLGTEFLVQQLPGDSGVRVALVSGSASLRRADQAVEAAVTLAPNDLALLGPGDTRARVEHGAELAALVAWHQGRLEFEDVRVAQVAAAITRWFGVPVVLGEPVLGDRRFTGAVRLDGLDDALDVLRLSLGVAIERRADTVVIR